MTAKNPFSPDKIFAHPERITEWLRTGLSRPVTFELDIANTCNHACPYCFGFHPRRNRVRMKPEDIRRILKEIVSAGGKAVTFTGGGEPLTHPYAPEALEFAGGLGLDTALITNGELLCLRSRKSVLRSCSWVRISLDAANPDTFRAAHGRGKESFLRGYKKH
ncbi:MAG: radical SAM protein [bacterium]